MLDIVFNFPHYCFKAHKIEIRSNVKKVIYITKVYEYLRYCLVWSWSWGYQMFLETGFGAVITSCIPYFQSNAWDFWGPLIIIPRPQHTKVVKGTRRNTFSLSCVVRWWMPHVNKILVRLLCNLYTKVQEIGRNTFSRFI